MSTGIKLNIQMFASWTEGVDRGEIENIFRDLKKTIEDAKDKIEKTKDVESALKAGWKGKDCDDYIEKFRANAKEVCTQIDTYRDAIDKEFDRLVAEWEAFQASHIS